MIRLSGSDAGIAACLDDGSGYAFYVVPGSRAAFSIAVHGGGRCADEVKGEVEEDEVECEVEEDEVECAERSRTALGGSAAWSLTERQGAPERPQPFRVEPFRRRFIVCSVSTENQSLLKWTRRRLNDSTAHG